MLLLLGILILTGGLILSFSVIISEDNHVPLITFIAGVGGCSVLMFCVIYEDNPQAIDVYRGNTTLEITYRDSIPVDSVVVYKNK